MIYSQRGINGISTPFVFFFLLKCVPCLYSFLLFFFWFRFFCFFVYIWYAANTVMIENKYISSY